MILYTPLSSTDIFPYEDELSANCECVSYQGRSIYAEKKDSGSYELLQLLSTDPQDFLNSSFIPGTILANSSLE